MSEFENSDMDSRSMGAGPSAGAHVLMDYVDYASPCDDDAPWILDLMRGCVIECGIKEVHSHVESFDGKQSPPGFAAVVLIDESHVTAHCYSERGILAGDVFTCGTHDPDVLADSIHNAMSSEIPGLRIVSRERVERFKGD